MGAVLALPLSLLLKVLPEALGQPPIPFLDRTLYVFLLLTALMVLISLTDARSRQNPQGLNIRPEWFRVSPAFPVFSVLIVGILAGLYAAFW